MAVSLVTSRPWPRFDLPTLVLDSVLFKHKFQQPALLSVTPDGLPTNTVRQDNETKWRLPALDLRNEQKFLYRLHSLDIYFWTASDASRFVDCLKRLLPRHQLDLTEPPTAVEHRNSMSPVVEKLEHAAIHDPPHLRTPSNLSTQVPLGPSSRDQSPQPALATPAPQQAAAQPPTFAPYNPAAPAAPERIAHREKTPPPPDGDTGTGLAAAAMNDQNPRFAAASPFAHQPSYQHTPPHQAFPGPPQRNPSVTSVPPPPPSTMPPTTASGQGPSLSSLPALPLSPPPTQLSFAGPPQQAQPQQQAYSQQQIPGHPLPSPNVPRTSWSQHTPLQSPGLPPPPQDTPIGGYSNYTYAPHPQQSQSREAYQVHGQLYKPTESEANHGQAKPAQPFKPGAFESGLGRLEKGVGRFLKKLDK